MGNSNTHTTPFLEKCDVIKMNGISNHAIHLRLIPFSEGLSKIMVLELECKFLHHMDRHTCASVSHPGKPSNFKMTSPPSLK